MKKVDLAEYRRMTVASVSDLARLLHYIDEQQAWIDELQGKHPNISELQREISELECLIEDLQKKNRRLEKKAELLSALQQTPAPVDSSFSCPDALKEIKGIRAALVDEFPPCVYFLVKDDQVKYVGQSINLTSRLNNHRREKEFDCAFFLPVSPENLSEAEQFFIKDLDPDYNIALRSRSPNRGQMRRDE